MKSKSLAKINARLKSIEDRDYYTLGEFNHLVGSLQVRKEKLKQLRLELQRAGYITIKKQKIKLQ